MLTGFGIRHGVLRIASNFSYDLEVRLIGVIFFVCLICPNVFGNRMALEWFPAYRENYLYARI